jgi:hypothetical protein
MAIKRKICNSDPASGKKMVAYFQSAPLGPDGYPYHIEMVVRLKEADEETEAAPPGTTERDQQRVSPYTEIFRVDSRMIDPTTKVWDTAGSNPSAIALTQYWADKVLNTFPGTAGSSPLKDLCEGMLREVIEIKHANGEWPNN